jgi:hypothetical protein
LGYVRTGAQLRLDYRQPVRAKIIGDAQPFAATWVDSRPVDRGLLLEVEMTAFGR